MEVTVVIPPLGIEIQAALNAVAVSGNGEIRVGQTRNVFDDLDTELWSPE